MADKNIILVDINKEMKDAYLQYSMSVIVGRALPDVRDGLKPVHRRILFSMYHLNNFFNKPYKKSARVVGDVIGKYHPHGDKAVYDSIVRMAQDFSLRYPLIDGQGNFGSIDGDSPAAHRYTEVRMTELSSELLQDIEKETVPFEYNYDDTLLIPTVLPSKFPNLLVNGSSGIAVGMATNIPPHNLIEVINSCLAVIENKDITVEQLLEICPGPDFPTAAVISGRSGIVSAYKTGKGSVKLRSVTHFEKTGSTEQIIVTELPYQVNKARLIENIAELVRDKKIEDITDIRDESSKEGIRVVIILKRNASGEVVLNQLYKFTQLQNSFHISLLALDAESNPKLFTFKQMISSFLEHRKDVIYKRCIFDLKKARARLHILEGLLKALDSIDAIIKTIRASSEASVARKKLIEDFAFSLKQANAILEMKLQRLTGLEKQKIENEVKELNVKVSFLQKVVSSVSEIYKIIIEELTEIKEKFNSPRLTKIEQNESEEMVDEDLITEENIVVALTKKGFVKRMSVDEYRLQKRGGVGVKGSTREEDFVTHLFSATTHTLFLVFSNFGKVYYTKGYKFPMGSRTAKGSSIRNIIKLEDKEQVQAILPITSFGEDKFLLTLTTKGVIKKTELSAFEKQRKSGLKAVSIEEGDTLKDVCILNKNQSLFIATKKGMSIHFKEDQVRAMGRSAKGVRGIRLRAGDEVIGLEIVTDIESSVVLLIGNNGYGKRTNLSEYRLQSRAGTGITTYKVTEKTGPLVAIKMVKDDDQILLSTNQGQAIRTSVKNISIIGRSSQGVRLMNLKNEEKITGLTILEQENLFEKHGDEK
ncbi:MAG: DNA gyrase subunit A [Bdellovibrionaceae bacterium]|nr:DNA gyrase subunit A [Pseudobdellovibrionaceae bacterium]